MFEPMGLLLVERDRQNVALSRGIARVLTVVVGQHDLDVRQLSNGGSRESSSCRHRQHGPRPVSTHLSEHQPRSSATHPSNITHASQSRMQRDTA